MIESGTSPAPVAQWTECLTSNQLVARSNRAGGILLGLEPPEGGRCQLVARSNRTGGILFGLEPPKGGRCQLIARSDRFVGILLALEPPEGGRCQSVARSNRAGGNKSYITLTGFSFNW